MRIFAAIAAVYLFCVPVTAQQLDVGSLDPGSMRAFSDGCRQWLEAEFWEAWLEDPGRDPELDDRARKIFHQAAGVWADMPRAKQDYLPTPDRLARVDMALMDAPESQVLQMIRASGVTHYGTKNSERLLRVFRETKDYSGLPFCSLRVANAVRSYARSSKSQALWAEAREAAYRQVHEALDVVPEDPMEQRYLVYILGKLANACSANYDFSSAAESALATANDGWPASVIAGRAHKVVAWSIRGSGYAHTVDDEEWEGFHARLDLAAEHFVRAHEMRPAAPEAASEMIDVSKGSSAGSHADWGWFTASYAAQPTWFESSFSYLQAIQPRWGGSVQAMVNFTGWLADESGGHPESVDFLYTAIEMIGEELDSYQAVWSDDDLTASVRSALETQIKSGVGIATPMVKLVGIAWARGEWEECRQAYSNISVQFSWSDLRRFRVHEDEVVESALLWTLKGHPEIQQALTYEEGGLPGIARKLYEKALVGSDLPNRAHLALRSRAMATKWAELFKRKELLELDIEPGLPGWRIYDGVAEAVHGNISLRKASDDAWISPNIDPGRRFEMNVTCHKPPKHAAAMSKVIVGYVYQMNDAWTTVELDWLLRWTCVRHKFARRQSYPIRPEGLLDDGIVNVRVICYDGDMYVEADGHMLYRGPIDFGYNYTPGTQIMFVVDAPGELRDALFSDVSVVKLNSRPTELQGEKSKFYNRKE